MLKRLGSQLIRTAFRSPWQNGIAERWVGSCRRELLDDVIVLNENHLRRLVRDYIRYYHEDRTHDSLDKDTPERRAIEPRKSKWIQSNSHASPRRTAPSVHLASSRREEFRVYKPSCSDFPQAYFSEGHLRVRASCPKASNPPEEQLESIEPRCSHQVRTRLNFNRTAILTTHRHKRGLPFARGYCKFVEPLLFRFPV
jgi:Integrase core domain